MKTTYSFMLLLLLCSLNYSCESTGKKDPAEKAVTPIEASTPEEAPSTTPPPKAAEEVAPVYGIDVSQFQGDEVDFLNKQKDSLSFIICKATEGITYTDPDFRNNWKEISEKGFIKGAYHFYHTKDNPKSQADNYLNAIKDLSATNLPPIVDFEGGGIDQSQSIQSIQEGLITFLNQVETSTNRKPMIYTDIPTGNKYLNDPKFADYALWIALYEDVTAPELPHAWEGQKWTFWQKSSSYKIDGKKNDFDVFNGSMSELLSFIESY